MTSTGLFKLPPLSLYIHIPWCVKKCPYCDFNSHESRQIPEAQYTRALLADLQREYHWVQGRQLHSIFFGGGTPSLFSAKAVETILLGAEQTIGFDDDIEITLEANPGTFEQDKFRGFFQAGVNRLSVGIQTFHEQHLKKLGRIHNRDEAINAVNVARAAGFTNINLDLMHGLPGQSPGQALGDLQVALDLQPQHISWYQLTIEPNTVFYRHPPNLPEEGVLADIQGQGEQWLWDQGFRQYEVSAFARHNKHSRHNSNYWSFGDYIGIGAGAHGKCTDIKNRRILRRRKSRQPDHYLAGAPAPGFRETVVTAEELALEFMMNALRLGSGVPANYFTERTGLDISTIAKPVMELVQQGLLEDDSTRLKTTARGRRFLNSVLTRFTDA